MDSGDFPLIVKLKQGGRINRREEQEERRKTGVRWTIRARNGCWNSKRG